MKAILLIHILTFSFASFGQKLSDSITMKTLKGADLVPFTDSLKAVIFQDTLKFKRSDLIHTNMGTRNTKAYSPVYLVNMKYSYKLDIINGTLVREFVDSILDPTKITSVDIIDIAHSQALFGVSGMNGTIMITTKKNANINFKVAGLTVKKNKKQGDNFSQRQDSEIKILL